LGASRTAGTPGAQHLDLVDLGCGPREMDAA
jgi:hypothetical protein